MKQRFFTYIYLLFGIKAFTQCDSLLVQLKVNETRTVNAFTSIREFHQGLLLEIGEANEIPYSRLDSLFGEMQFTANAAITERMRFEEAVNTQAQLNCDSLFTVKNDLLKEMWAQNNLASNQYQSMCASFGVMRTNKYQIIDRIYKYIVQMQDSLELQYKIIFDAKAELDVRFNGKKEKEYFEKYAPVSEMEAIFKKMEGNIIQLENLQSRMEDSNGALYYWSGPLIPPRQEVAIGDQIVSQCLLLQRDFMEQRKKYEASKN